MAAEKYAGDDANLCYTTPTPLNATSTASTTTTPTTPTAATTAAAAAAAASQRCGSAYERELATGIDTNNDKQSTNDAGI